ncbi:MAG TPA: GAF domain-containing sensor histidine kinase [Acidimicrobiia bacterium]
MPRQQRERRSGRLVLAAVLVIVGGGAGSILLAHLNGGNTQNNLNLENSLFMASFLSLALAGSLLAWRRPANAVGWLLVAMGVAFVVGLVAHGWAVYALDTKPGSLPGGRAGAWLALWANVPTFAPAPFVVANFPSGRIIGAGMARLARLAAWAGLAAAAALAFKPGHLTAVGKGAARISNPLGIAGLRLPLTVVQLVAVMILVAFVVVAVVDLVRRFRCSEGEERLQFRWVALAATVIPVGFASAILIGLAGLETLSNVVVAIGVVGGMVAIAAALAVSVLKYHLYELSDYLRRGATYLVLTGLVALGYWAAVSLASLTVGGTVTVATVTASAIAVVSFGLLRGRLQRAVDRLLYGRRADPYGVLNALSARVEAALAPDAVLPTIVETVGTALRLPYVAITPTDGTAATTWGTEPVRITRLALLHQHERLGDMIIGHRSAEEDFTPDESALLESLARQAATAVHAATLTEALEQSRDRAVRSREEERRRLRRDLHDGVGPTLAGLALRLDALHDLLGPDAPEAKAVVDQLKGQLRHTVEDVRRLVADLRPPAIDELGLLQALRHQADALTGPTASENSGHLDLRLNLPTHLPELPAAVEVAVYRIASEALTNVIRHAHASNCSLDLVAQGSQVCMVITDDGIGLGDDVVAGVGLSSMRERAEELGGACTVADLTPTGTRVEMRLPIVS